MISASPEGSIPEFAPPAPMPVVSPLPIERDKPQPEPSVSALVEKWRDRITRAKGIFDTIFTQMGRDQDFLRGKQWEQDAEKNTKYVANITQRLISQKVAAVYAKNPVAKCRRRKTLDFVLWDGERSSLLPLQEVLNPQPQPILGPGGEPLMDPMTHQPMMGPPAAPDPNMLALLADVQQGLAKRFMMDRIAATVEIVFEHEIQAQTPPFKKQMKQMVRRAFTNAVGYAKVGYQRFLERRLEDAERVTDITQRLADIAAKEADLLDGQMDENSAEAAQLRFELESLQGDDQDHVSREGLVFDFPKSRAIIVDPRCSNLSGFVGAQWVAQEYHLDKSDVEEIFQKDVGTSYTGYSQATANGTQSINNSPNTNPLIGDKDKNEGDLVCVWEIYAKKERLVYYIADGYPDFLQPPAPPKFNLKRFWPWFPLVFNESENDAQIYPVSDVGLMRPMQLEYNRSRDGLREHRYANRPATAVAHGALDPSDEDKLKNFPRNALIKLKGLQPGQKVEDLLQVIKRPPIDPALYNTSDINQDVQLVMGASAANMGNPNDATATGQGIAESSRMAGISSNIDDLNDMLDELFYASGEILFSQMSADTAKQIAGPGAVWPELTAQDIANELYLEIEAGSSGTPDKAVKIANIEKIIPLIMQIPGVAPEWILKILVNALDDNFDPTDAVADAVQSIVSQNRGAQTAGPGANVAGGDPHMQGPQGGQMPPPPTPPPDHPPQGPQQPPAPGGPPGAMAPHPTGPRPPSGPVSPAHPALHTTLTGPIPGQQTPSRFVNPANV